MKDDRIRNDFVNRTVELAMKTHEEIQKLADDHIEAKRVLENRLASLNISKSMTT